MLDVVQKTIGVAIEDTGAALEGLEAAVGGFLEVVGHPGDLVGCVVVCGMSGWRWWDRASLAGIGVFGQEENTKELEGVAKP